MQININQLLNNKIVIPAVVLATAFILVGGFYLYQSQKNQIQNNPQTAAAEEVKKLVKEVGVLIELPTEEDPTVATITDITKLADQPFFQKGKNGDKVLIYTNAKKAILYDPITKKVIDVAPINIGTQSAQESQKESLPKIALRNGTKNVGLTTKIETKLKQDGMQFETSSKENAKKQDYEDTLVVVLNESVRDLAQRTANVLSATLGDLPEGEAKPDDADILIILGKDVI